MLRGFLSASALANRSCELTGRVGVDCRLKARKVPTVRAVTNFV